MVKHQRSVGVLFWILLQVVPGYARAEPYHYVNDFFDFVVHMKAHVDGVRNLGLTLYRSHPEEFKGVPESLVTEFLSLHDQSKLNPLLSRNDHDTVMRRLFEFYGKSNLDDSQKQILKTLVDYLNGIDKRLADEFFTRHKLKNKDGTLTEVAQKLLMIEKVSDRVERGMNLISREEFGRTLKPNSSFATDPLEKKLSLYLENYDIYDQATRDTNFIQLKERIISGRAGCINKGFIEAVY